MSKKDEAFELFDQGYATGSPEVKALGIAKNTRKNYHNLWRIERANPLKNVDETKPAQAIKPTGEVLFSEIPIGMEFQYQDKLYTKHRARMLMPDTMVIPKQ